MGWMLLLLLPFCEVDYDQQLLPSPHLHVTRSLIRQQLHLQASSQTHLLQHQRFFRLKRSAAAFFILEYCMNDTTARRHITNQQPRNFQADSGREICIRTRDFFLGMGLKATYTLHCAVLQQQLLLLLMGNI